MGDREQKAGNKRLVLFPADSQLTIARDIACRFGEGGDQNDYDSKTNDPPTDGVSLDCQNSNKGNPGNRSCNQRDDVKNHYAKGKIKNPGGQVFSLLCGHRSSLPTFFDCFATCIIWGCGIICKLIIIGRRGGDDELFCWVYRVRAAFCAQAL